MTLPPTAIIVPGSVLASDVKAVHDNASWTSAVPHISVVIPTFRHDASWLMEGLSRCASPASAIEVIVYDDGSRDDNVRDRHHAAADRSKTPMRVVTSTCNKGRAGARNSGVSYARANWILLMDADMAPDSPGFVGTYLAAIAGVARPALIVGGYSLNQAPSDQRFDLHRWQARTSECIPASARCRAPGRHVFSSNVLAHRDVLADCPFDENFAGWGWEDTDWGLRAQASYPIIHIDNTATHLGLDPSTELMAKYARSGGNFGLLAARHPRAVAKMPLHRAARFAKGLPCRALLTSIARQIASSDRAPVAIRGRALKAWRALVYADAL
ncbi:MAG: glycosyltransferase [Alphaproteobacteria bacterium]|nr:glycosyltransferase [Alphaproteobacteria bacterium]